MYCEIAGYNLLTLRACALKIECIFHFANFNENFCSTYFPTIRPRASDGKRKPRLYNRPGILHVQAAGIALPPS